MKKLTQFILGAFAAAVLGLTGLALATGANTGLNSYIGYNPTTNLFGTSGVPFAVGPMPVLSGGTCGTLATVQASETGGSSVVQFASNSTACTLTLTTATISPATAPAAAPNGLFCVAVDETHPADVGSQSAHTTTSCTVVFAATTSGDLILVEINGF